MSADNIITNFDYLARVFGIQALNNDGERILTDDEIIYLILPYYFEVDPWCQYAICTSLAGIRNAVKLCAKIYELKGDIANEAPN